MFKTTCPAKINLFLKLLGKRPDGYTSLESLFAFLDLADELEVRVLSEEEIIKQVQDDKLGLKDDVLNLKTKKSNHHRHPELVSGSQTPILEIAGEFKNLINPQDNLFIQILNFFAKNFQITKNLHIKITKNIPVGAGLGGGSSDAASFMKALNNIFSLNLSKEELQKISLNFGSDIAFFFEDKASIVRGRGDLIENFSEFSAIPILLVNPKIHISTKEVFAKFNNDFSTEIPNSELQKKTVLDLIKKLPNDLTIPAISISPTIKEILEEMKKLNAKIAKMSGSGSTCFAIFGNENDLENAAQNISKKFPSFLVRKTKILSSY
jgi:4-diphosphocytidyl-2-C-methyl-D-erythritol kinase